MILTHRKKLVDLSLSYVFLKNNIQIYGRMNNGEKQIDMKFENSCQGQLFGILSQELELKKKNVSNFVSVGNRRQSHLRLCYRIRLR